jgi:hypothetical protein
MAIAFFHSFPRKRADRSREDTIKLGLDVLDSMMKWGLLLIPEATNVGGVPLFQRRLCFTALDFSELPEHAEDFGEFALEYDIATFLKLGALPAFYLPNHDGGNQDIGDAGRRLLFGLHCIEYVMRRLKDSTDPIAVEIGTELKKAKTDLHNLAWVPTAAKNLFYPAGSERRGVSKPLAYYAQREWKIIENFPRRDESEKAVWDFEKLRDEQKADICSKNSWFEGEVLPGCRRIDECMILEKIDGNSVIDMVSRIIVPADAHAKATAIVGNRVRVIAAQPSKKS